MEELIEDAEAFLTENGYTEVPKSETPQIIFEPEFDRSFCTGGTFVFALVGQTLYCKVHSDESELDRLTAAGFNELKATPIELMLKISNSMEPKLRTKLRIFNWFNAVIQLEKDKYPAFFTQIYTQFIEA